jgi:hypothetical protein
MTGEIEVEVKVETESRRLEIAKLHGWTRIAEPEGSDNPFAWWHGLDRYPSYQTSPFPDYPNDLNALYKVEKYLGLHNRNNLALRVAWINILRDIVAEHCPKNKAGSPLVSDIDLLNATSIQRTDALIKLSKTKSFNRNQ